ncbi:MAG: GTPase Era, partial [Proteobacteria bacterium]
HKPIVIGKGASVLKEIGMAARKEIEEMMGQRIFLDIKVNFKEDWYNNKRIMQELGYARDTRSENE